MATNTEPHALVAHWIATAKTQEMVEQYVAALQWNVDDCNETLFACGDMLTYGEHAAIWQRGQEAKANLELAQKRLAEMSAK